MPIPIPAFGLQLRSLVKSSGELEISLVDMPVTLPGPDEVLVRISATPINPSDQGLLFGAADMSAAKQSGTAARPVITAPISPNAMPAMAGRLNESMPVGNEGAGQVVKAGSDPAAQALLGHNVAIIGGAMYAQYRVIKASQCLLLPIDATPIDGASCFVNPLTALGMVETMRMEGHTALVHTAAASNLGQMLNRICIKDGIKLVNIVRNADQAKILSDIGAQYIVDSSSANFKAELTDALAATNATLAFDAIGGGTLTSTILSSMEAAINRNAKEYSRYGSAVHKQVYQYGMLERGPTVINRDFGMAWGVGGWLLFPFLNKAGKDTAARLRARVAAELKTTFASSYSHQVSLAGALQLDAIQAYGRRATGEKYLIRPDLDHVPTGV